MTVLIVLIIINNLWSMPVKGNIISWASIHQSVNINGGAIHNSTSAQLVSKRVLLTNSSNAISDFRNEVLVPRNGSHETHIAGQNGLLVLGFVWIWSPGPYFVFFSQPQLQNSSENFGRCLGLQGLRVQGSRCGSGLLRVPWARIPTSPSCSPIK